MAALVMVRVYGARNLPVMDSTRNTTDAYVLIRLGDGSNQNLKRETRICYNSLDPVWNQSFRFKLMDESLIYENPLRLTVFDKDTFTANDPIGTVVIALESMISSDDKAAQRLQGWFPVYDTLKGIVGHLYVQVRVQRVAGLCPQFYSASLIEGYNITRYCGFVDELIVSADPEHRWQGLISGARKTNESRQLLFYQMAGQVKQNISRKASALGANSVIGYRFDIDFEGSHGVIARGYGTAVLLSKVEAMDEHKVKKSKKIGGGRSTDYKQRTRGGERKQHREDSGLFPLPRSSPLVSRRQEKQKFAVEFLTVDQLPPDNGKYLLGGAVNARVVRLITGKRAKQDLRDEWWSEVRDEIRSHAQSLQCSHVLGYCERATIYDDVCILSASGTAIRILTENEKRRRSRGRRIMRTSGNHDQSRAYYSQQQLPPCSYFHSPFSRRSGLSKSSLAGCRCCLEGYCVPETVLSTVVPPPDPYYAATAQQKGKMTRSSSLNYNANTTPSSPTTATARTSGGNGADSVGGAHRGDAASSPHLASSSSSSSTPLLPLILRDSRQLVEARVCRHLSKLQGEPMAMQVSENILFIQYDLYRQLIYKLRVLGLNAAFGLTVKLSLGENLITAVATATGCYVTALPPPAVLRISRNIEVKDEEDEELFALQKKIMRAASQNYDYWQKRLQSLKMLLEPPQMYRYSSAPATTTLTTAMDGRMLQHPPPLQQTYSTPKKKRTTATATKGMMTSAYSPSSPVAVTPPPPPHQHAATDNKNISVSPSGTAVGGAGTASSTTIPSLSPQQHHQQHHQQHPPGLLRLPSPSKQQQHHHHHHHHLDNAATTGGGIEVGGGGGGGEESSSSSSDSDEEEDGRRKFVLHVDDEADEDIMAVLLEPRMQGFLNMPLSLDEFGSSSGSRPSSVIAPFSSNVVVNIGSSSSSSLPGVNSRLLTFVRRFRWRDVPSHKLNQKLASIFQDLYASLLFKSRGIACNIQSQLNIPDENEIEIVMMAVALLPPTAAAVGNNVQRQRRRRIRRNMGDNDDDEEDDVKGFRQSATLPRASTPTSSPGLPRDDLGGSSNRRPAPASHERPYGEWLIPPFKGFIQQIGRLATTASNMSNAGGAPAPAHANNQQQAVAASSFHKDFPRDSSSSLRSVISHNREHHQLAHHRQRSFNSVFGHVQLSTLERLPCRSISKHLGRISVHIIRESFEEKRGTLAKFTHELLAQINSIARAQVFAKGGNALLSYTLLEYQVDQESTRQSYSIMSLSGDAVQLAPPRAHPGFC